MLQKEFEDTQKG